MFLIDKFLLRKNLVFDIRENSPLNMLYRIFKNSIFPSTIIYSTACNGHPRDSPTLAVINFDRSVKVRYEGGYMSFW